jgi:hypothetical protein
VEDIMIPDKATTTQGSRRLVMKEIRNSAVGVPGWGAASVMVLLLALAACDFDVSNPGPVDDPQLNEVGAHNAVVQGASFALSIALWQLGYITGETADEITRSGRNFCCPKAPPRVGELLRTQLEAPTWNVTHRARFVAEAATRRFEEVMGGEANSYPPNAWAKLYAGYANRLLGEHMCTAFFDGGPPEPNIRYFERAEVAFTEAIAVGQAAGVAEVVTAAYAGRASVRGPWLGKWSEAVADAQQVPRAFRFQAVYSAVQESNYNFLQHMGSGSPWVDWTVWGSDIQDLYLSTGDPRIRWRDRGRTDTPLGLPLYEQRKYTSVADNINLATGREMLLVRAEAALSTGNWQGAMLLLNDLRSGLVSDFTNDPLPQLTAANSVEAWTHLKRERRLELWLEGRRMPDLRRWIGDGANMTPGAQEDMSHRIRLCFPVNNTEADNNVHIDRAFGDAEPMNPTYAGG